MKNLTVKQVIEFMFSEQEMNNSIISASIGNGGSGLDIRVWSNESIQELEDLQFNGKVEPCADIEEIEYFSQDCSVYQFSDENGSKVQILTF